MKKRFIAILVILFLAGALFSCGGTSDNEVSESSETSCYCETYYSQDSYLNYLQILDEENCEIVDISRDNHVWSITYLSTKEINNTPSKSINSYFCEIFYFNDPYTEFLQSLDLEKYKLVDISRDNNFWCITYKLNN